MRSTSQPAAPFCASAAFISAMSLTAAVGYGTQTAQFFRVELEKHSELARRGGAKLD